MGYPLSKREDDTLTEMVLNTIGESMKSVGQLMYNNRTIGTAFRVGSKYLMTAWHVAEKCAGRLDNRPYVDFSNDKRFKKFYYFTKIMFYDQNLDFAVIEISDPDQDLPSGLKLYKDNTEIYSLNSVHLIGYGHPNNEEKNFDPNCKVVSPTSKEIDDAKNWLSKKKSFYRSYFKATGLPNLDKINLGLQGCDMKEKFLLHCYMKRGASGAPVLATVGWEIKVVGILTHGLPEFYYLLPGHMQIKYEKGYLFEVAAKMAYIYRIVNEHNPILAADLFSI